MFIHLREYDIDLEQESNAAGWSDVILIYYEQIGLQEMKQLRLIVHPVWGLDIGKAKRKGISLEEKPLVTLRAGTHT